MVAAVILLGEHMTVSEFSKAVHSLWIDNTGLTMIEYRDQIFERLDAKRYRGWVMRVWNDHAHLG